MRARFFTALVGMAGIASAATTLQAAFANTTVSANTTSTTAAGITKIDNKVLILARDADGANSASAGLSAYGIPFEQVTIPKVGGPIPALNTTATEGKYSGIIVMDALSYGYDDGWRSAVTEDQWNTIWAYQANFKVRMVRINEFPGPSFGAGLAGPGGCCDTSIEQLISFTDTSLFSTANLKT